MNSITDPLNFIELLVPIATPTPAAPSFAREDSPL
jgi:hypothetical protein